MGIELSSIKILVVHLSVCLCVTDVGMTITNLRVVCKIITCVSVFIFHRQGHINAKDAIVSACHCTSDRQEHNIIWRAGPERDMIFHLCVPVCREHARQPL